MPKINYEPLLAWMDQYKIRRVDLSDAAERAGTYLSAGTIGKRLNEGKAMPSEVILAWKESYRWTDQETMYYCLNGGNTTKTEASMDYVAANLASAMEAAAAALASYMKGEKICE